MSSLSGIASASFVYPASDEIGQTDSSGNATYAQSYTNNLSVGSVGGFNNPTDVKIDTVHHELYVSELSANRIQVYNLNTNNQLVHPYPDYILGQSNFESEWSSTSQSGLSTPFSMAIDTAGQRLFVADEGNHRVLVFNTATLSNNENASYVLGQPNFTSTTQAHTQSGMSTPAGLAYDPSGQRLFVADSNRVLVFNVSTITDGMAASNIIGQSSYTTATCPTISQSVVCDTYGLAYDSTSKRLFVLDTGYFRVLVFNVSTITDGMAASNVLGQPNFTSSGMSLTQAGLDTPRYLTYDPTYDRLLVSDLNRILVFSTSSISNGENATAVLGQSSFTTSSTSVSQNQLTPYGMAIDSTNNTIYVADLPNNRVMEFNDSTTLTNGQNAVNEMGQTNLDGSLNWTSSYTENNYPNDVGLNEPSGEVVDTIHHRLFVSDQTNNRVLEYNLSPTNQVISHSANAVLGQPDFTSQNLATSQSTLSQPDGLAYDPTRNWLYVDDMGNDRIIVYDVSQISNGENALYVLGQPDFTSNSSNGIVSASTLSEGGYMGGGLAYDDASKSLFVPDTGNNRVLVFNMQDPSNDMSASYVIGQSDFSSGSLTTTSDTSLDSPDSVTYDPVQERLYVADTFNSRVLVFGLANIANGMAASYVLGQPDFASTTDNWSQNQLFFPSGVSFDPTTGNLWVAEDAGILLFNTANLSNGMNASAVIGEPDFTSSNFDTTQSALSMYQPLVYVDPTSQRIYATDYDNNRVMMFDTIHIVTADLPNGISEQAYNYSINTSGSQGTVSISQTSGTMPPGLTMNSSGIISGTPTTTGTYTFVVEADDNIGSEGVIPYSKELSITVSSTPQAPSSPSQNSNISPVTTTISDGSPAATAQTITTPTVPTTLNADPSFSTPAGTMQNMTAGQSVAFTEPSLDSSSTTSVEHHATVTDVGNNYVDMTIASNPIHIRLYVGQTKDVDVNGGGKNDLSITLLGISKGKAQLDFRQLMLAAAPIKPTAAPLVSQTASKSKIFESVGLSILIVLACFVIVIRLRHRAAEIR